MKLRFLLLFVSVFPAVLGAATVALVGEGERGKTVALQVLAAGDSIDFVDREELAKLLAEQKIILDGLTANEVRSLARPVKADLFVWIGEANYLLFEGANGFRLVDEPLPEGEAPAAILQRIRGALATLAMPQKAVFLSVAGIRDGGIPDRFWPESRRAADEFLRHLSRMEGVILLERDYLDQLAKEQALTGETGRLAAAARMIHLEFLPGASARQFLLRLRLTGSGGEELFRGEAAGGGGEDPARLLLQNFAVYLAAVPPELPVATPEERKREAARFFAEAEWMRGPKQFLDKIDKLRTAWLLDPENPKYRKVLMENLAQGYWANRTPEQQIRRLELACRVGAPDFSRSWLSRPGVRYNYQLYIFNGYESAATGWPLEELYRRRNKLSLEQLATVRGYAETCRDFLRRNAAFERKRAENATEKWEKEHACDAMTSAILEGIRPEYYFDDARCRAELMGSLQPFFEVYPKFTPKFERYVLNFHDSLFSVLAVMPVPEAARVARELAGRFAAFSPSEFRNLEIPFLVYAAVLENADAPDKLAEALRELDRQREAAGIPDRFLTESKFWTRSHAFDLLFQQALKTARAKAPAAPPVPGKYGPRLTEQEEAAMLAEARAFRASPPNLFKQVTPLLRRLEASSSFEPAFAERLNPEYRFEQLWPAEAAYLPDDPLFSIEECAAGEEGTVWLLSRNVRGVLFVHRLNPVTGETARLSWSADPAVTALFRGGDRSSRPETRLTAGEGHLLAVIDNRALLIPLSGAAWQLLGDWPEGLRSATIRDGRLWGTGGRMLVSSDFAGGDRRVHFSTLREDDPLLNRPEGRLTLWLEALLPDPLSKKALLILGPEGVWRFDPEESTFALLVAIDASRGRPWIGGVEMAGGRIFFMGATGGAGFLAMYDCASKALTLPVGHANRENDRTSLSPLRWMKEPLPPPGRFLPHGNRFFLPVCGSGGGWSRVWNIGNPDTPDPWYGPPLRGFLPHPDGRSVLAVTRYQVLKMTPKKEDKP